MKITWKKLVLEIIGYSLALGIVVAALFVSVTRLIEPALNDHKTDFEKIASRTLERPVTIGKIRLIWEHLEPEISLNDVMVLDKDTQKPVLEIPSITANFQIWQSLLKQQFLFESLKISGVHLVLRETSGGMVSLKGFGSFSVTDNFTGQSLNPDAILKWIFSQPYLFLKNMTVQYIALNNTEKSVTLKLLELRNDGSDHLLQGSAILNQDVPTRVKLKINWSGEDVTDLAKINAKVFLHLENLSLPQWFSRYHWRNLRVLHGIGSAVVWAEWNNNSWQNVRSALQFYDVQGESLITKKNMTIARLSGKLKWRREGASEIIDGDDILIDLPYHLWPTTSFSLGMTHASDNTPVIQSLSLGYLDLGDAGDLISASGLLPDNISKWLTAFNPKGEIHNANLAYLGAMDDVSKIKLSGEFSKLSLSAWDAFPGLNNIQGALAWDGVEGSLKLDSRQTSVTLGKVFADHLAFDELIGQFNWKKDVTGKWMVNAQNLHAVNDDLNVSAKFTLQLPVNASPVIDLSGDFSVAHADQISRYLPLKIFDRDLVEWLQQAFSAGQVVSGKAVLSGKLSDYPFDHHDGNFTISAQVRDVNLQFAPDWPALTKLNGELIFSGRNMKVNIVSGQTLGIPLNNVKAEIPYLGDEQPQVLNVSGEMTADHAQGLNYIHSSPLQKTLGQDLAALQLSGVMQLKLNLSVPLSHPDNTKVQGYVTMSNATLSLPEWNLTLTNVKGAYQFTEDSITAHDITGQLFSKPFLLSIATQTQKNKPSTVVASITHQLSITDLQNWLDLPLGQYVQGETRIQADLTLPSHNQRNQPTQVLIKSDLQGVKVNLPANYGKAQNDKMDFRFLINAGNAQPLKLKLFYGKLFSAAATLKKENQKTTLFSGDLHLGATGSADWQTQPGIMVTGNLDKVEWSEIAPYLTQLDDKPSEKKSDAPSIFDPSMLRGADIKVNQFILPTMKLNQLRIQLTNNDNSITIGLTNPDMAGQIIYPFASGKTIEAKFQRLNIIAQESGAKTILTPDTLPPISFVGDDVRYGSARLGRLSFDLTPNGSGAAIRLNLDAPALTLHSTGMWQKSSTHLQGNISTKNIGKLLESLGFAQSNLVGSTGNANFDLNWQGAPFQPTMSTMSGKISIKLGEGRVINLSNETNAEMGFGRMLNIFSLQSIPRRLSLNFSDLFENGYNFDYITGDFSLKSGNAFTENTRIDGPVARVDINGRIGLASKDYNLKMAVTPYVTASLPVITTIATVNPIIGVATWMVDKVVSRGVSQIITYQYTITGPWSNPVWEKVGSQKGSKQ